MRGWLLNPLQRREGAQNTRTQSMHIAYHPWFTTTMSHRCAGHGSPHCGDCSGAEDGQLNRGRQRHALHPTWPPGQSTLLYPAGRQTGLEDAEGAAGCLDVRSGCCFSVSSKVWLVYCCLQPVPAPTLQDMGLCHHGTTPVKIGVWHAPSIHMQFGYMSQGLTSMWATEVLL